MECGEVEIGKGAWLDLGHDAGNAGTYVFEHLDGLVVHHPRHQLVLVLARNIGANILATRVLATRLRA